MCVPDTSYLSSPDFLLLSSRILLALDVPILSYGTYCILFKTPNTMRPVKWLILNLHFWSSILEIILSLFGVPFVFLPHAAGYGLGLIEAPKVWIYLGLCLLVAVDASIALIYENRYYMLYARDSQWAQVRKPCLAAVFTINLLICQPPFLLIPDQPTARKIVLEKLPSLPQYSFKGREMFVLSTSWEIPLISLTAGFFVLTPPIVTFLSLTFYHLAKSSSAVSHHTQKLQRQLIKALTLQSSFLIAILGVPFLAVIATMILEYHYQGLNNLIYVALALHGTGSTIVMILVHQPYRDFTISAICGRFKSPLGEQPELVSPSLRLTT
uniref:Serpentine Receptor, class H n=1 Tax=Caenorhabditis japonica TaxID=281687 RepID=A0A8R1HMR2_CAEJA